MTSVFVDAFATSSKLAYSLVSDLLGLPSRGVVFANWALGSPFPTVTQLGQGGIVVGVLGLGSGVLIGTSVGLLCGRARAEAFARTAAWFWVADAALQVPGLLAPGRGLAMGHPASWTGMPTLAVQLPLSLSVCFVKRPRWLEMVPHERYFMLTAAVSARHASMTIATLGGVSAASLYGIATVLFAFAVTPRGAWKAMSRIVAQCARGVITACSFAYGVVAKVWPRVEAAIAGVLQHPAVVGLYRRLLEPMWASLSPWFLPYSTTALALLFLAGPREENPALGGFLFRFGRLFCGVTSLSSSVVLGVHALGRTLRREWSPLSYAGISLPIKWTAGAVALPWSFLVAGSERLGRWLFRLLGSVSRPLFNIWASCLKLAHSLPMLTIPAVLLANMIVVRGMANSSSIVVGLSSRYRTAADLGAWAVKHLQCLSWNDAADSTLLVLLVSLSQTIAFTLVKRTIQEVDAVRQARTGSTLSPEELNDIAVTMQDPRQCPQCHFGPVDSQGCDNLSSHHGEVRTTHGSLGVVSNACPRCGWFGSSLASWQHWDPSLHTTAGEALFRQRAWNDVVVVLRASSKGLVLPFALLGLGQHRLGLSPAAAALLVSRIGGHSPWSERIHG